MVVVGVGVPCACSSQWDPLLLVGVVIPLVPAGSRRGAVAGVLLLLRRRIEGVPLFSLPATSARVGTHASSTFNSFWPSSSMCQEEWPPGRQYQHQHELRAGDGPAAMYTVVPDSQIRNATIERFLKEIAGEKPIRFTAQQLAGFTNNYLARLGAGGFGTVYKGMLPNGHMVGRCALGRLPPPPLRASAPFRFTGRRALARRLRRPPLSPARRPAVCSLPVGWPAIEEWQREREGRKGKKRGKGS
uniref:Protein kinase domain-containing protein n=2 Tax=Oryza TaxID=4527 RepID=A0A0E0N814_ORYRU